jgi:hypothetical protein
MVTASGAAQPLESVPDALLVLLGEIDGYTVGLGCQLLERLHQPVDLGRDVDERDRRVVDCPVDPPLFLTGESQPLRKDGRQAGRRTFG